jgi:hypothetical protein
MYRERRRVPGTNLRRVATLVAIAFAAGLGVTVGTRISSDALAVLVGVTAGVGASIPTALILLAVTRRREQEYQEPYEERRRSSPPVIVVAPSSVPQVMSQYPGHYAPQIPGAPSSRQFKVMGLDEDEAEAFDEAAPARWYE